jgi:F-type H+-transporting ATPase subunit delta
MLNVVVSSAVSLTAGQLEKIKKAVAKKYGKDASVATVVDPNLIGGVTITLGSRQFDGSVKGKIARIKQSLEAQS